MITLFLGRLASLIPFATLAGILLMVCWHMGDWPVFRAQFTAPKSDLAVMLTTFLLTVFVDLSVAIAVGMVLAAFLFMKRMAEVTDISVVTRDLLDAEGTHADVSGAIHTRAIPPGVEVYEINGPFFFGAADKFKSTLGEVSRKPKVLIIRMRHVPVVDATAMTALRDLVRRARADRTVVMLADVPPQPLGAMGRAGLLAEIGEQHVHRDVDAALAAARSHLA